MDALDEVARALVEGGPMALPITSDRASWIDDTHDDALLRVDALTRRDAPAVPPAFDAGAARWALGRIAHLAHRIVDREAKVEDVAVELAEHRLIGQPRPDDPSHVWSVDLALRHLPSIERPARGLRSSDPVRTEVGILARHWPLSSVALPATNDGALDAPELPDCIRTDPSLRRIYLDRVTAAKSVIRARTAWVVEALTVDQGRRPGWLPEPSDGLSTEVPARHPLEPTPD